METKLFLLLSYFLFSIFKLSTVFGVVELMSFRMGANNKRVARFI